MADWFNLIGPDLFELGLLGKNHSSLLYASNYIILVIYSLYNLVSPITYRPELDGRAILIEGQTSDTHVTAKLDS